MSDGTTVGAVDSTQEPAEREVHPFAGARLRSLRERAGLTRAQLAERLGLPNAGIVHAWEQFDHGTCETHAFEPTASQFLKIAAALDVEPRELTEMSACASQDRYLAMDRLDEDQGAGRALRVDLRRAVLSDRRVRRGLSVEELAARARVDRATISLIEDSIDIPYVDELARILSVLYEDPARAFGEVLVVREVGQTSYAAEDPDALATVRDHDGVPLRDIRERKGLTVVEIAALAKLEPHEVQDIESVCVGSVAGGALADYLDALGVPLDDGFRLAGLRKGPAVADDEIPA